MRFRFGAGLRGRGLRAGLFALAVSLCPAGGRLAAEQPVSAAPGTPPLRNPEVDLTPGPPETLVLPGDPLHEALSRLGARLDETALLVRETRAEQDALAALEERNQRLLARVALLEAERAEALTFARDLSEASELASARVRYLVAELLAARTDSAQLGADLAVAEAARAKIDRAARAKEAALTAWIDGLHDELAEREAELSDAVAGRAQSDARLEAHARATKAERVQAAREAAAMRDQLEERDRQMAAARAEGENLRRRLSATQAELRRRGADYERLLAELTAARSVAEFAAAMARETLTTIEDQIGVLQAATGDGSPDASEQPWQSAPAMLMKALPAMPYPKPRLQAGVLEVGAPAGDTLDGEVVAAAMTTVEEEPWVQASMREPRPDSEQPSTGRAPFIAPDDAAIGDLTSTAALLTDPPGPGQADDRSPAEDPMPLLEWGDGVVLIAAATRLAEALRTTREAAISGREERVLTIDVEQRAFAAHQTGAPVPLDPALDIHLVTARSELVGDSEGGIRFYPDGSSTGGRIELELSGDRAAISVQWSTGAVILER